ncbi:tRNA (guanine(10)-N2)-methyltransferase homolog isoform X4 [Gordionus sp. m RMFG-2023]|uniref:tRNA (guanine(10)-N2)-methyltransferase homolog isoform X4 n=1 Tax=Gordionus sp. m RMFG-2023 TaxID=3053472 RepID=UPI0031FC8CE4
MIKVLVKYILVYANEYLEFRLTEFKALNSLFGNNVQYSINDFKTKNPFIIVESCDKASMVNIVKRSILIKYLLEYWANSSSSDLLVLKLKSYPISFYEKYRHSNFKFKFHCFGQTISQEEKLDKMEMLSFLPFEGRVKLNDPEQVFIWLEYYDEKSQTIDDYNAHLYFGRWLSNGLRAIASNFKLSDRKYIGNTSMDPKLSFLLTNIAQITATDLVLDPFVGSGSLILSAAYHEAYVSGIDIEKKMLYATGVRDSLQNLFLVKLVILTVIIAAS